MPKSLCLSLYRKLRSRIHSFQLRVGFISCLFAGRCTFLLSSHDQIRQASSRFAHGVDRLNADLMKSAYWPDATDDHGFFKGNAHEFCDYVISTHKHLKATMHCMLNHLIQLDESSGFGQGEVYTVTYVLREHSGSEFIETWWGRYEDTYERRHGEWRIKTRLCIHEFTSAFQNIHTMNIDVSLFKQGSEDRGHSQFNYPC